MSKIELMDGKYTVINELEEGGGFRALRYGEKWRNLNGDNLILAMFFEIEEQREFIAELESEVFRLQDELNGDGVLTLAEQVEHARAEIRRQDDLISELYSIALWAARRMLTRQYSAYMYDEIEKVTGEEVDRDWRGTQV